MLLAVEFRRMLTTAAAAPGISVPLAGEASSHTELLERDQLRFVVPRLVRTKFCDTTSNGPPIAPNAEKPPAGCTDSESGIASASIKAWPAGVPHPVQRSYPGTA